MVSSTDGSVSLSTELITNQMSDIDTGWRARWKARILHKVLPERRPGLDEDSTSKLALINLRILI